jgi:hypothetical protein
VFAPEFVVSGIVNGVLLIFFDYPGS